MTKQKKMSGIQRKYLKYTIALLVVALLLSSIGIWQYMRRNLTGVIIDKYKFMNEKMGITLDNLFTKSDEVTAECIVYDDVQKSLKVKTLEEVKRNALSKYFAYIDLDHVSDYCYIDNKQNVYTRSYSHVSYDDFKESGFEELLGEDYARTKWIWTEDTLFGTKSSALFIGRYVRSMEYSHDPGMLFFKMNDGFLEEIIGNDKALTGEVAVGILDAKGELCKTWMPQNYEVADSDMKMIRELAENEVSGVIADGEMIDGGILSAYRQADSGMVVFTLVPNDVLNRGLNRILLVMITIYLFVIAAAVVLSIYFSQRFTKPIQEISKAMTGFDGNDFTGTVQLHTNTELDQIGHSYNEMLGNIKRLLEEVKAQEKELRISELNTLISQINPHFLYNTLDTIYMLARINKEEKTMKMIEALSKYLRLSLSKGNDIVTVEDELENVKSYMEIQEIRNENLFRYEINCEVDQKSTKVLKLILQPLVENSIKYGFCDIYEGGIIRISVKEDSNYLIFSIYNSGKPIEKEMRYKINSLNVKPFSAVREAFPDKDHGYGIVNVMTRLRLKYGEEVRFYYEAKDEGTECVIKIPKEKKDEEE